MNIDICYFGVFLVFVLAIGQVTPPVGLCLFVACDIGKVSIEKVSREVLPYVGGLIVTAIRGKLLEYLDFIRMIC